MTKAKPKPGFAGIRDETLTVRWQLLDAIDLTGKRALVVGGTNGLGRAIARAIAGRGGEVVVVGQTFRDDGARGISFVRADLGLMRDAARAGATLPADVDVVVLTTGIIAAPTREVTPEGIERDMAVSYLSRLALLSVLAPRLAPRDGGRPRVFIMGFPGTGEAGKLGDLNAESTYKPMEVHMNTVAGNEALVLDGATRYPHIGFYGLNPGLIKTGIRANYLGDSSLKHRVVESLIGLFTPTPETYATRIVPVLFAPELATRTGVLFNQKAQAILPSPALKGEHLAALLAESNALVQRAGA